jgi:Domain of unknown function (DUF4411)
VTSGAGKPTYCVDTSGLIDGIERFYPITNFPALWDRIDDLIEQGRLRVSEEVWNEAISVAAPLKDWCTANGRDKCVYPTDVPVAGLAGAIAQQFPKWVGQGTKNGADPFVVAVAELNGFVAVSGETNGGPARPKIPYVCSFRSVPHCRFADIITTEGWVFG